MSGEDNERDEVDDSPEETAAALQLIAAHMPKDCFDTYAGRIHINVIAGCIKPAHSGNWAQGGKGTLDVLIGDLNGDLNPVAGFRTLTENVRACMAYASMTPLLHPRYRDPRFTRGGLGLWISREFAAGNNWRQHECVIHPATIEQVFAALDKTLEDSIRDEAERQATIDE